MCRHLSRQVPPSLASTLSFMVPVVDLHSFRSMPMRSRRHPLPLLISLSMMGRRRCSPRTFLSCSSDPSDNTNVHLQPAPPLISAHVFNGRVFQKIPQFARSPLR